MAGKSVDTPLMRQYNQIKSKYPDALLLFRVGDFYETFGEDAVRTSKILGIVLTKRANGSASEIELAGFPHHSLDNHLPKLVRSGQRVAICDQLEDPRLTKKIVKRGVMELVTPGVITNDQVLQLRSNNFLCAVHFNNDQIGVAFCDISTGEFLTSEGNAEYIEKLLQSLQPSEIIYPKSKGERFFEIFGNNHFTFSTDDWVFKYDYAFESLTRHFKTNNLKGYGIENLEEAIVASGAIFHYLKETKHDKLSHITGICRIDRNEFVWMDRFTIRNLELFQSNSTEGISLLDVIDCTQTPMGSRLLKRWLAIPLKSRDMIIKRLIVVEKFILRNELSEKIVNQLQNIYDLERLVAKLGSGKIQPKEMIQLKKSLDHAFEIKKMMGKSDQALSNLADQLNHAAKARKLISEYMLEEPSAQISKGSVIGSRVSKELDELRDLLANGKNKLLEIQQRETKNTGIQNLKISFNNVFGYYFEVRNTHKDKVPQEWVRKQTLVNAERYITEELKEYEQKILGAEEKILQLENKLYFDLIEEIASFLPLIQQNAQVLARIDCLLGFSLLAKSQNYTKPNFNNSHAINIVQGRHPVIENSLAVGDEYVANDVFLDREQQQILMITGPNMSGKSAFLRQTALISILAQIGSFIPAKEAKLGIVDKIFVRVGASDNISHGESTFMVEMNETASILNNLSKRSLVILDEIGRGTSTYDGISIAWAIAEFLHEHPSKAKTLFATHYHELNEMENSFERIKNFNVSVRELNNNIIFMRKLMPGGSEHSFGIHVAKMAGMPGIVINRAGTMLKRLEKSREQNPKTLNKAEEKMQLSFFDLEDPIIKSIREDINKLDIDTLTPVEALMKLVDIKKKIGV